MISISSPAALHVLSVLYEGPMSRRTALSRFSEVRTFDNSDLADLEAIGFVTETRDSIEITGDGREYLEFFDERQ
jgi:ribosomal protein S19E (S16A)